MCDSEIIDDKKLISQIKSAFESFMNRIKLLISGKSKNAELNT
jgi:hypothetical protein